MTRTHRSPGIILIELLAVLVLFGVFSVVAGHVLHTIMLVTMDAHDVPRLNHEHRAMLRQMRADVWGAVELEAEDGSLTLRYTAERSVKWTLAGENDKPLLRRTAYYGKRADAEQTWELPGPPARFEPQGPGVRVHFAPIKNHLPRPLDLYSELVQLNGGGR